MNLTRISEFFVQAVMFGVPLLYGAVGEILTEKVGHLNLGIPGIMYVGGISGIIGGYSHSMQPNAFSFIFVSPFRFCGSDSAATKVTQPLPHNFSDVSF